MDKNVDKPEKPRQHWLCGRCPAIAQLACAPQRERRLSASRQRLPIALVNNNFPCPDLAQDSKANPGLAQVQRAQSAIETAAQGVLDARDQFPGSSLADLYDPLTMPPALLKAHRALDAAVDKAYELSGGKKSYASDAERVAFLFGLYQQYTSLLPAEKAKPRRRAKT